MKNTSIARTISATIPYKRGARRPTSRHCFQYLASEARPRTGDAYRIGYDSQHQNEAKCSKHLGAQIIRSEFGKAYDLRVATYLIWSFYSPAPKVIQGARSLGIDVHALGFDTERRLDLIKSPEALISHIAHSQEQARQRQRFALTLVQAGEQAGGKLSKPRAN